MLAALRAQPRPACGQLGFSLPTEDGDPTVTDTDDSPTRSDAASNASETETAGSESTKHVPFVLLSSRPDADPYHVHTTTRVDWTPGHSCPVCGSTRIASAYIGIEQCRHYDGTVLRLSTDDEFGPFEYQCVACDTLLRQHVAFDLLDVLLPSE